MKWFKHFTNSSSNNKLTKVRMKYGADGYAIYWYCLELIAGDLGDSSEINFDLKHDAEVIGFNLKIDQLRVEEIMNYMVSINLFNESNGVISCIKLAKYLDVKLTRNESIKRIINSVKVDSGDRHGYLYLMEASKENAPKEIKIGRSSNPWARLPEINRSREKEGFAVTLLSTFKTDDCISLESSLHQAFKSINIKNEWFQCVDDLVGLADDINNGKFKINDDLLRSDYVVNSSQLRSPLDKIRLDKNINTIDANTSIISNDKSVTDCPHQEIINLYKKNLPNAVQPRVWNGVRPKNLKARWKEDKEFQDLEWWDQFFSYITRNDFLMGRISGAGRSPFEISLDWIVKSENFYKIVEGKYSSSDT